MEWADLLGGRRMVRRYDPDRPVPDASIDRVVAAAVRAPSAGFTQGVSYLVLTGDGVANYWSVTVDPPGVSDSETDRWLRGLRTAPVLIGVWTDESAYLDRYALPDKGWTDRDPARWSAPYWWVDAGMGVMAALLAAVEEGLGACFFGVPAVRIAAVREAYGVPDQLASVGVISLGHPAVGSGSKPRRARRPAQELVHRGTWH